MLACAGLAAGPAAGSSVSIASGVLTVVATPGEVNSVNVVLVGTTLDVDDLVNLTAGAGCTPDGGDPTHAICSAAGVSSVVISAGDMNDVLQVVGPITGVLAGGDGDDVIRGSDASDTLLGEGGNDTLEAGAGDDLLDGGAGDDTFEGGEGNDRLGGGDGNDTLSGGEGDDALDGGTGADDLNGGNGADWADYSTRSAAVAVNLDDPARDGGPEDVAGLLTGDNLLEIENLRGGTAADTLIGNNVPNVLDGGPAGDLLDGRDASDQVDYSLRTAAVSVNLGDGFPDGGPEDGGGDTLSAVEGAIGSQAADTLRGDGNDNVLNGAGGNDVLIGGLGADYLLGGDGSDSVDYSDRGAAIVADLDGAADDGETGETDRIETDVESLLGGAGNDTLTGNNGANALVGNGGNDTLNGLLGADSLAGGGGTDSVSYAGRTTAVVVSLDDSPGDGESGENDNVSSDVENVTGGSGNDVLRGSSSGNVLNGGPGGDLLDGGLGADVLTGSIGTDTVDYSSRSAGVTIDLDGVADDGAQGENDNVSSDIENVTGGTGSDTLRGSGGPNVLVGNGGADTVVGLAGADTLNGGAGNDDIRAEDGVIDQIVCGGGNDTIEADAFDNITGDCEDVIAGEGNFGTGKGAGKTGKGSGLGDSAELVLANGAVLLLGADGTLRVKLRCPKKSKTGCKGRVTLTTKAAGNKASNAKKQNARKKGVKIGVAKYKVPRAKVRWVRVKLTKQGVVMVGSLRKLKVVVLSHAGGKKKRIVRTIYLRVGKAVKV